MRYLACLLLVAAGSSAVPTVEAQPLPPELIELFEQIGIELDENGAPLPQPAPPAPPAEPLTPEDLAERLGIPVELLTLNADTPEPTPAPEPAPPRPIADPLTPEELSELLGIPIELLVPDPEATPPAPLPTPETPPPTADPEPQTLEELADLLGIPVGILTGEATPPAPASPPPAPAYTPDDLEFWQMLGFTEIPGQPAVVATAAAASAGVPEPGSLILLAIAAGFAPRRRR